MSSRVPDPELFELSDRIRMAAAHGRPLCLRGGGTKDFYGQSLAGEPLDLGAYRGIIDYEPTELVISARCGTTLAEIQTTLDDNGQMLAFEPPTFGEAATIGGVVAAGLSGPRRAAAGAVRDFVLGAALLDAGGRVLNFGGRVMKNVAGYDVSRLLAGSLGILGPIVEVSLKVLPKPPMECTVRLRLDESEALRAMNEWAGQPLPISATVWHDGGLALRFSGAAAAVEAAVARFEREHLARPMAELEAQRLWWGICEQTDEFFDGAHPLWRLSLPSTAPALDLNGAQVIEWNGALRWLRSDADVATIRAVAERVGGTATLFRGGERSVGVFHPLAPGNALLHRRLKQAFDPGGIFNPGRMYPVL